MYQMQRKSPNHVQAQNRLQQSAGPRLAGKLRNPQSSSLALALNQSRRVQSHFRVQQQLNRAAPRPEPPGSGQNVVQGVFKFGGDEIMQGYVAQLEHILSVESMKEDENFTIRFERKDEPEAKYTGYTHDEDGELVIGINTAKTTSEGDILQTLLHELILHAEPAWEFENLEDVLDRETIQSQHQEIIQPLVQAPDESWIDGLYLQAQKNTIDVLAESNRYQVLGDFVQSLMDEQSNVLFITLGNHFAAQDEKEPFDTQYNDPFTKNNVKRIRNNVIRLSNYFLGATQTQYQQHVMHRILIGQVKEQVKNKKNAVIEKVDEVLQSFNT